MRRSWPKYLPVFLIIAFLLLCFLDVSTNPIRSIFIGVGIALLVLELVYFIALSNNGFFNTLFNKILSISIFPVMVLFLMSLIYFIGWGLSDGDSVKFVKENAPVVYTYNNLAICDAEGYHITMLHEGKYSIKELSDDRTNKIVELEGTITTKESLEDGSSIAFEPYDNAYLKYELFEVYYDNVLASSYQDISRTYYTYHGTEKRVDIEIVFKVKLEYITIEDYKGYIISVGRDMEFSYDAPECKDKKLKRNHFGGAKWIAYQMLICDENTPNKYLAEGYEQYIYGKTIVYIGYSICGVIALSKIVGFTIYNIKNNKKKEEE